jgi:hypothetical protein
MSLLICISLAVLLALSACSHTPKTVQQEELGALQEQLKVTVVKALNSLPGVAEVNTVEILKSEETNGIAKISYKANYVSASKETGPVSNDIQAEVYLTRSAERNWTVTRIQPHSQSVVFHDAEEIVVKRKRK